MITILDGNAFYLRITGKTKVGEYEATLDLEAIDSLIVNFVRRVRESQAVTHDQGKVLAYNDGKLAKGVYGVEMVGYYNGQPWRFYAPEVFEIADGGETEASNVIGSVNVYDVTFYMKLGGDGVTPGYVDAAVTMHNTSEEAHSDMREAITGLRTKVEGRITDLVIVKRDGTEESKADVDSQGNKIAVLNEADLGKVAGIIVNDSEEDEPIDPDGKVHLTIPQNVTDLEDADEYATKEDAQAIVDEAKVTGASVDYQEDGGSPSATVDFSEGSLGFTLKNMKMRFSELNDNEKEALRGPQGIPGESVIVGQGDLPLSKVVSLEDDKAVTPKAVTEFVEGKDNAQYIPITTGLSSSGYYRQIPNSGSGDYVPAGQSESSGCRWQEVSCSNGDKFLLYGKSGAGLQKFFAFINESRLIIQRSSNILYNTRENPTMVVCPKGATSLIVNYLEYDSTKDHLDKIVETHFDGVSDKVLEVAKALGGKEEMTPQDVVSGKVLKVDGTVEDSTAVNYRIKTYAVNEGYNYWVTCRVPKSNETCGLCFYYSNGLPMSPPLFVGDGQTDAHDEVGKIVKAPMYAAYMKLFGSISFNEPAAYKIGEFADVKASLKKLDVQSESSLIVGYQLTTTGELAPSTVNARIKTYNNIEPSKVYFATFRQGKNVESAAICYYDGNGDFISSQFAGDGTTAAHNEFKRIISIPEGASIIKVFGGVGAEPMLYSDGGFGSMQEVYEDVEKIKSHPLYGKKVAVIGDSISTIYGNNNPYFKIQEGDVGQTISSYVSWNDIYNGNAEVRTNPTNKTIGGVLLTESMIDGELHEFTPVAEDVGKELFVPRHYSGNTEQVLVWSEVLCEKTGATLIANASFSGSSINSSETIGRGVMFTASHAWHPCTIGRCKTRDGQGNDITPDVIIIARGTNDFSYTDNGDYPHLQLDFPDLSEGFAATDDIVGEGVYNFVTAYMLTIQRLRQAYPKANIICATPNVFKRVHYDVWPTRNDAYTLPQFCDTIRKVADYMGCGLVEFDKDGITFENCYPDYISDSATTPTHPNANGHRVMGEKAAADISYIL